MATDIKSNPIKTPGEGAREAGRTVGHTLMIKHMAGAGLATVH